jgi:hypothetical protein
MFVLVSDQRVADSESTSAAMPEEYQDEFDLINLGLPVEAAILVVTRP